MVGWCHAMFSIVVLVVGEAAVQDADEFVGQPSAGLSCRFWVRVVGAEVLTCRRASRVAVRPEAVALQTHSALTRVKRRQRHPFRPAGDTADTSRAPQQALLHPHVATSSAGFRSQASRDVFAAASSSRRNRMLATAKYSSARC